VFVALTLVPSGAHLAELWNKIDLSAENYLIVQQIYRGWALFGIVVIPALIATLVVTIKDRRGPHSFGLSLFAFVCVAGGQVIFWTLTFPTNQATRNWTTLPADWTRLREQWEYSHASAAVLNLVAFIALVVSAVAHGGAVAERQHTQ
jgi:hypothetical protein